MQGGRGLICEGEGFSELRWEVGEVWRGLNGFAASGFLGECSGRYIMPNGLRKRGSISSSV